MNERPAAPPPLLNVDITVMLHAVLNAAESPVSLAHHLALACIGVRCSVLRLSGCKLRAQSTS